MMTNRQGFILRWVKDTFGDRALNPKERGARLVEEALELGQACGLEYPEVGAIVDRVFSRPSGTLKQEIGGVQICLEALAEYYGIEVDDCTNDEFYRIMRLPPDYFEKKYADKESAGILHFEDPA